MNSIEYWMFPHGQDGTAPPGPTARPEPSRKARGAKAKPHFIVRPPDGIDTIDDLLRIRWAFYETLLVCTWRSIAAIRNGGAGTVPPDPSDYRIPDRW